MISKWFIGVSAKSKGFFTGWQYGYGGDRDNGKTKPSFTKQSALADSFSTKADANKRVAQYLKESTDKLTMYTKKLKTIQDAKHTWLSKDQKAKMAFLANTDISVEYENPETRRGGMFSYNNFKFLRIRPQDLPTKTLTDEEVVVLDNVEWEEEIKKATNEITLHTNRVEFINTKLVVREEDIEIKFMDSERRKIRWTQRDENATSGGYCNCCGGAVPNIPQLIIGDGRRNNTGVIICAICMDVLSQEAKIQAGKIPDEIMEHYQTDRFIRSLD